MVERQLLASPLRSPAQARNKNVNRQSIYAPLRTPSPSQTRIVEIQRPLTPMRPPLLRQEHHVDQSLIPSPLRTPSTPPKPADSRITSSPRTPVRTPEPLIFSAPATPAPTPGPIGSRKDRRTTLRVAHVAPCNCEQFKHKVVTREPQISGLHPGQPLLQWEKRPVAKHVSVSWSKVPINILSGVAISYTWGDFERENMIIGHWHDDPTRAIAMQLGTEWDVSDLLDRLVELTDTRGAIWMDQLCVPQREDYIREILPKVPDIFRTMEVAVLMPGGRCQCLERMVENLKSGKSQSLDVVDDWLNEKCHNKAGLSSYTNRMWAHQEFRYAQHLRIVWNNKEPAQCFQYKDLISGKADISRISGYATALFMQKLHEGFDLGDKSGYWLIHDTADKFVRDLRRECYGLKEEKKDLPVLFRMLLGQPIERVKEADEHPMWELTHSLKTFCRNLRGLAYGTLTATNPKDLVLSVWVDLPGYKLPAEMKFLSASELLDEAARKMEDTHHVTLSTHAPAGLFKESPGGCWRPEVFLAKKHIREVKDLYSTLSEADSPIYMRDGKVPLQAFAGNAIGRRAFVYRDMFNNAHVKKIGPIMSRVVKNLGEIAETRLGNLWHDYQDRMAKILAPRKSKAKRSKNAKGELEAAVRTENLADFMTEYYFFDNLCSQNLDEGAQLPWETLQEVDHYKIVYRMTCYLLGLDHEFCRKRGLELVIAPEEPAIIGLSNRVTIPSWLSTFDQDSLTISTSPNRARPEELSMCMLETSKCGASSDGIPEYRITGSWVACKKVGKKDLGAIAIPRDIHSVQKEVMRIDGWLV
ncbi:hypothetical protein ABW19_dt0206340 [Dactylella cylindrospora]|nr:hypothetical protein ABW19_dt0206340 [Dactylella cylindrospora]